MVVDYLCVCVCGGFVVVVAFLVVLGRYLLNFYFVFLYCCHGELWLQIARVLARGLCDAPGLGLLFRRETVFGVMASIVFEFTRYHLDCLQAEPQYLFAHIELGASIFDAFSRHIQPFSRRDHQTLEDAESLVDR